jgi:hypothetical protein
MEPSITVPIEAAPQVPGAALSIRVTGEEALTAARVTGIGGHQHGLSVAMKKSPLVARFRSPLLAS